MHHKTAVVTGAASGIGAASCKLLSEHGFAIVAIDMDEGPLRDLRDCVEPFGGGYSSFVCDVADSDAVGALAAQLASDGVKVDAIVNSAGIREVSDPLKLSTEAWERVLSVNLTGTFHVCRDLAPLMTEGGSIVNLSSSAGLFGISHRVAYSASKHGIIGLTRTLAADLADRGIRVNAVCPGSIVTPLTETYTKDSGFLKAMGRVVPMARPGTAEEVAMAIGFLVSSQSSYISGVALPVDGGWSATKSFDGGSVGVFNSPVAVD